MMWRLLGLSGSTLEKVLPALLCVMEDWPLHSLCTSDGDDTPVLALAVSFWNWPLFTPKLPLQQLSILSLPQALGETWARGWLRGHQARCSPCVSPRALPQGQLGTERCLGLLLLQATLALWVIVQVPRCHEAMNLYSSRTFVALLSHVAITTQQMPEEVDLFWRACQEEHRLPTNPNRSQSSCPSHALVASASAPSVTWALLCAQVCGAGHEGSALSTAL